MKNKKPKKIKNSGTLDIIMGFLCGLLVLMALGFIYSLFQPYTISGVISGVNLVNQSGFGGGCYYSIALHGDITMNTPCINDISELKVGSYCSLTKTKASNNIDKIECK